MVNFTVFNELSLPINGHNAKEKFGVFFGLLSELKDKGINQIRMGNAFKDYSILPNTSLQQFMGQQEDRDFKLRLKSFISNSIVRIEIPLIKNDGEEGESNQFGSCEYFYNKLSTDGGLACCDIWNTLAVSFDSDMQWDKSEIFLQKDTIVEEDLVQKEITIKHASKICHLDQHQHFFNKIDEENKLNITPDNFWNNKEVHFPKIINFCPEVEEQIKPLDRNVFRQVVNILRDIEMGRKTINDFNHSGEGQMVNNDPKLREMREFTVNDKKVFFQNHLKNLPSGYRMYFQEKNEVIFIGYIGVHLSTKRHKG